MFPSKIYDFTSPVLLLVCLNIFLVHLLICCLLMYVSELQCHHASIEVRGQLSGICSLILLVELYSC